MTTSRTTEHSIWLPGAQYADWASLVVAVLGHVQQAAHESGVLWSPRQSARQVRLELVPAQAALPHMTTQTQRVVQTLGARLERELAVRSFVVVLGRDTQRHRLLLKNF